MLKVGGTSSLNINPMLGINLKILQYEKIIKIYCREESSINYWTKKYYHKCIKFILNIFNLLQTLKLYTDYNKLLLHSNKWGENTICMDIPSVFTAITKEFYHIR